MPDFNVKSYNEMVEILEKMADGAKIHSSEQGFPPEITEERLRTMRDTIENSREEYEKTNARAHQLQNAYSGNEKNVGTELSRFKTMLYGFYGKKSRIILDFGMKPWKEKGQAKNTSGEESKTGR